MRIEERVKQQWERDGWTVFIKGQPDMFAIRTLSDGSVQIKVREIKGPSDSLRPDQIEVLRILQAAGVDARVLWTETGKETFGLPITTIVPKSAVPTHPSKEKILREDGAWEKEIKTPLRAYKKVYWPCVNCKKFKETSPERKIYLCGHCLKQECVKARIALSDFRFSSAPRLPLHFLLYLQEKYKPIPFDLLNGILQTSIIFELGERKHT